MQPTVLLHHTGAAVTAHYDWLLARDDDGSAPLQSFRAAQRIDQLVVGDTVELDVAPDHRPLYLTYEGALADAGGAQPGVDRGVVTRVARGVVRERADDADGTQLLVQWDGAAAPMRFALRAIGSTAILRRLA